jgi:hypothetical protein
MLLIQSYMRDPIITDSNVMLTNIQIEVFESIIIDISDAEPASYSDIGPPLIASALASIE